MEGWLKTIPFCLSTAGQALCSCPETHLPPFLIHKSFLCFLWKEAVGLTHSMVGSVNRQHVPLH